MVADGGSAPILDMFYDPGTNKNQAMNKTSFEGLQPGRRRGWGREGGPPQDRWAADEAAGESQVPAPLQNPWPGPAHWGAILKNYENVKLYCNTEKKAISNINL